MKITDLYSRALASEGKEFPLPGLDGKPSKEKITLRHADADEFREAKALAMSRRLEVAAIKDEAQRRAFTEKLKREVIASAVIGWSLEDECTKENVMLLLENNPSLAEWVDERIADSMAFFGKASADS